MAQITTTDANEFSSSAEFIPMRGFSNCHLQNHAAASVSSSGEIHPVLAAAGVARRRFCRSCVGENPAQAQHKPRLVVFHGLEGSLNSPYAHGLVEAAQKRGWLGVVMHFRGCSGEPNRMHRIYHSGETEDASWFYAGCNANLVMRQRLPSAIRSAVICWPVCWQRKAMISRLMRR